MKAKKLIKRLQDLIDADKRERAKKTEAIKAILDDLRDKEHQFKRKLAASDDEKQREKLQRKIDVCHAQRAKGLETLRELQDSGSD